jgi:uncharacterized protein (DUF2336 family)
MAAMIQSAAKDSSVDTDALLQLARDKSSAGRKVLGETIADLFLGNVRALSERERTLMFDILHQVVHDIEMTIRQTISNQIATLPDTPPELAVILANDDVEVAYPILTQSEVLQDAQLIETIRHRTLEHQMAIAIRHTVSVDVSDALVETGSEDVIRTLLENSGARISQATMEYLVEESSRLNTFQEPILRRHDLDPNLAKRMFMWVSAALRKYIVENFDLEKSVVDDLLEKAALQEAGGETHFGTPSNKSDELVAELAEENAVTPELLISALRNGQVHLFVSMFRRLTELRHTLVTRILLEPGGEGLAIASKAVGIDKENFSLIFSLSRKVRPGSAKPLQQQTKEATEFYDSISEVASRGVLRHWRRDADYLAAIRQLELTSRHG